MAHYYIILLYAFYSYVGLCVSVSLSELLVDSRCVFLVEGVLKLFLTFSPAKSRNISYFEQKKPMKLKKRLKAK